MGFLSDYFFVKHLGGRSWIDVRFIDIYLQFRFAKPLDKIDLYKGLDNLRL